jgi:hypothetical protein
MRPRSIRPSGGVDDRRTSQIYLEYIMCERST